MSSNSFGHLFRITTFGESHGVGMGVVIDGVPPRLRLDLEEIQRRMDKRRPGQSKITTARAERDQVEILSGIFDGETTGAPLTLVLFNRDARPKDYEALRDLFRPGHADYTYYKKYGIRDWRGGGRASGRETSARVAAGAVAQQMLDQVGVKVQGHVLEVGGIRAEKYQPETIEDTPVRCADPKKAKEMVKAIEAASGKGDSLGGIVEVRAEGVPVGWGDPVFGKLDALLAQALMSIGAVKGMELGDGFALSRLKGSESNDAFLPGGATATNRAGGTLGGISTGQPIIVRAAVKPTPSISLEQKTVDKKDKAVSITIDGRHDPCIAPRLVIVAEAMVALVLADACLMNGDFKPTRG